MAAARQAVDEPALPVLATATGGLNVFEEVMRAGPMAKFVLAVLVLFSVASWGIIAERFRTYRKAERESDAFLAVFHKGGGLAAIQDGTKQYEWSPLADIFRAGFREISLNPTRDRDDELPPERPPMDVAESLRRDPGEGAGVALERAGERELAQINRALARIEAGEYGLCRECGQAIAEARLEALPFSDLCIACAERLGGRLLEGAPEVRERLLRPLLGQQQVPHQEIGGGAVLVLGQHRLGESQLRYEQRHREADAGERREGADDDPGQRETDPPGQPPMGVREPVPNHLQRDREHEQPEHRLQPVVGQGVRDPDQVERAEAPEWDETDKRAVLQAFDPGHVQGRIGVVLAGQDQDAGLLLELAGDVDVL